MTEDSRARIDDGELRVRIRGLVIPATGSTNTIPTVRATVFCDGKAAATSASVPFSSTGDAEIRQQLSLPSPCGSPAVLIQPAALNRYIAFTQ